MTNETHRHLPRLSPEFYRERSLVHWVFTVDQRLTGWLDDFSHARIREVLLHTVVRYDLLCPVYCLMPDHMHVLMMGISEGSDQQQAVVFMRRHLNAVLDFHGVSLQKQAYDHVLREDERERMAFEKIAWYILENPVRAGLVKERSGWRFSGCSVPGHPSWSVFHNEYWPCFWAEYEASVRRSPHALAGAATGRRNG